jgi:imidazole glycerol phosphate synthase subunit HisF
VTLARRLCVLFTVDEHGKLASPYRHRSAFQVDFVEAAAAFLANDTVDEVWLRSAPTSAALAGKGPRLLYEPLARLEKQVFVPIVAWAPVFSPADARLLLGFGADRVVVDVSHGLPDPLEFVSRVVDATGPDRVTCAVPVVRTVAEKGIAFEVLDRGNVRRSNTPTSRLSLVKPRAKSEVPKSSGIDALSLIGALPGVGAAEVLWLPQRPPGSTERTIHDGEALEKCSATLTAPLLSFADDVEASDLATPLMMGADGVVTELMSRGAVSMDDVRRVLREFGVPLRS